MTALGPTRYRHIKTLDFCPMTLLAPTMSAAEPLRFERIALIGAGAIGTAIALILDALGATGELIVGGRCGVAGGFPAILSPAAK